MFLTSLQKKFRLSGTLRKHVEGHLSEGGALVPREIPTTVLICFEPVNKFRWKNQFRRKTNDQRSRGRR
jgi:hypothetical protein